MTAIIDLKLRKLEVFFAVLLLQSLFWVFAAIKSFLAPNNKRVLLRECYKVEKTLNKKKIVIDLMFLKPQSTSSFS